MAGDTAAGTVGVVRRVVAALADTVAGPVVLVVAAAVGTVAVADALTSDPLDDLPAPVTVEQAPVLPSDREPDGGWAPGTRGAVLGVDEDTDTPASAATGDDGPTEEPTDDDLLGDLTDAVPTPTDGLLDELDDTVGDTLDDTTDTIDDTVDDTVGDALDDTTDVVQDTLGELSGTPLP